MEIDNVALIEHEELWEVWLRLAERLGSWEFSSSKIMFDSFTRLVEIEVGSLVAARVRVDGMVGSLFDARDVLAIVADSFEARDVALAHKFRAILSRRCLFFGVAITGRVVVVDCCEEATDAYRVIHASIASSMELRVCSICLAVLGSLGSSEFSLVDEVAG